MIAGMHRLFVLNLVACACHLALAVAVGVLADLALSPNLYKTKQTFVYDSTGRYGGYDLRPRLVGLGSGFPISALVLFVEAFTALVHFANVLLWPQAYAKCIAFRVNYLRWGEYAVSASVMAAIVTFVSGARDVLVITVSGAIVGCLQGFGLLTELFNRDTRGGRWRSSSVALRLFPHFLAYPLFATWAVAVLFVFVAGGGAPCSPWYVTTVVVGQVLLFATFAFPQLWVYSRPRPNSYGAGEAAYISLSLTSKAFLAIVLLLGVLQQASFDGGSLDVTSTDACPLYDTNGTEVHRR